jgi:hypothetical protein
LKDIEMELFVKIDWREREEDTKEESGEERGDESDEMEFVEK